MASLLPNQRSLKLFFPKMRNQSTVFFSENGEHFFRTKQNGIKDGERVLLCLKRSLRIANAAQQMANATRGSSGPVTLFVEILNKYLYFFEKGNPQITSAAIQDLVELIKTEMQSDTTTPD